MANENRAGNVAGSTALLTVLIVVAVLYFARVVFMPLALAVLLAFLLAPLVLRLRRWGLGRIPSVVSVVLFSFLILAVIGSFMTSQLTDLARKLPGYQQNIRHKVESIRTSGSGLIDRVSRLVHSFTSEVTSAPTPAPDAPPSEQKPAPVEAGHWPFSPLEVVQKVLGSVLNVLVTTAIVIVFVIFILIGPEDLRDRLIRLIGAERVNVTTQALDDAARRLSRYLLAQLVVNVAYGVLAGIGLYFIGVPDPLLWGILAALLRYIPYLGIWIAATMPAAVAFAVEPGWAKVPVVFGLYLGLDLLAYNFVEPLLYGTSIGVSPIGILAAAVFWTWLWGPVGLLLATPLTVCVVVVGRYVPTLQFLSVMLSDEPVLPPATRFYQRLLAMDFEEAGDIARDFLNAKSLAELYDAVFVPALSLAEEERHRGDLDAARQKFIFRNTRLLAEQLARRAGGSVIGNRLFKGRRSADRTERTDRASPPADAAVVCLPARDEADEIAGVMLSRLLRQKGRDARVLSVDALAGEAMTGLGLERARVVCVLAVPPFGYTHASELCRRLRAQAPELKLLAAILTERDAEEIKKREPAIPADQVLPSLEQTLAAVLALLSAETGPSPEPAAFSLSPQRGEGRGEG